MVNTTDLVMGEHSTGLTTRAYIATAVISGLCSNATWWEHNVVSNEGDMATVHNCIATAATDIADRLIEKLNEQKP